MTVRGFHTVALVAVAFIAASAQAQTQTWERLIRPGLTYRMEIDLGMPRVIHALRYTPGAPGLSARPELAQPTVFNPGEPTNGRATLTQVVQRTQALAGINADFFPWTGDPIGLMVRGGELISIPFQARGVFAWGAGYRYFGPATFAGRATVNGEDVTINGVNQEAGENQVILNAPIAGVASAPKGSAVHVILKTADRVTPGGTLTGEVTQVVAEQVRQPVEAGTVILTATGTQVPRVAQWAAGTQVTIRLQVGNIDWSKASMAVAGGPVLLPRMNLQSEGIGADFSTTRHPRTAIGRAPAGDIWLVVVDGRQSMSRGASLPELVEIMSGLGCTEALNLDGGGSTGLNIMGMGVNRPSGGTERAIANTLLLFGPMPEPDPNAQFVIRGVPRLTAGQSATYAVVDQDGQMVPLREVIWAATDAGWIDQAGILRTLQPGVAKIQALVRGKVVSVEVTVEAAPGAPAAAPAGGGSGISGRRVG